MQTHNRHRVVAQYIAMKIGTLGALNPDLLSGPHPQVYAQRYEKN